MLRIVAKIYFTLGRTTFTGDLGRTTVTKELVCFEGALVERSAELGRRIVLLGELGNDHEKFLSPSIFELTKVNLDSIIISVHGMIFTFLRIIIIYGLTLANDSGWLAAQ